MQDALLTTTGAVGGQIAHQAVILDLELQVMVPKEEKVSQTTQDGSWCPS